MLEIPSTLAVLQASTAGIARLPAFKLLKPPCGGLLAESPYRLLELVRGAVESVSGE